MLNSLALSLGTLVVALVSAQDRPQAPRPPAPRPNQPAAAPQQQPAPLRVEPAVIDLGRIDASSKHPVQFTLRNITNAPQTILDARPSCKCTALNALAGRTLQPGEAIALDATMDAPSMPGDKDAQIFILVEGFDRRIVATIKSVVVMPIESDPPFVDIREGRLRATTRVVARDGKPFRILSAGGNAPVFADAQGRATTPPSSPQAEYQLVADFTSVPTDQLMQYWVIETDRADCAIVPVQVRHEATGLQFDPTAPRRRWLWSESLFNAGLVAAGTTMPAVFEISRYDPPRGQSGPAPMNWGEVIRVASRSPLLTAELLNTDTRGDKVVITMNITFAPEADGRSIYVPIEVTTPTGTGRCFVTASVRGTPGASDNSSAAGGERK